MSIYHLTGQSTRQSDIIGFRRSVAQLEEQRSPKPQAGGSSPPTPAISNKAQGLLWLV